MSKEKADLSVSRCSAWRENRSLQHMAAGSPPVTPATAGLPAGRRKPPKAVLCPNLRADPTFLLCETGVKGGASSWTHEAGRTGGTVCPGRLPGGAISPPPGASSLCPHTPCISIAPTGGSRSGFRGSARTCCPVCRRVGWEIQEAALQGPSTLCVPRRRGRGDGQGCGRLGRRGVLPTEGRTPGHLLPALGTQEGFRAPGANHLRASEGPGKNRGLACPRGSYVVSPAC